ncbi:hypothetical protein Syun_028288 [Stephania yunnanensis]|uniref:Uncharacterized protein n=1 Tax=Stephania yunnanensis TaxID=152371 RepID=A0AAP0EMB3_9MAGN
MICCWLEDPNSDAFKLHLPRVEDYLWMAEDGMKMQASLLLSQIPEEIVGEAIAKDRLFDVVNVILSMQMPNHTR